MSEEEHYHNSRLCTDSRCGCPDDSRHNRTCPYCKHTASGYRHCPYCKRSYDVSPGYARAWDPGAYRRRLMEREEALAHAELSRLDEQYPVWAAGYGVSLWARERCAYITGDDAALERMTGYVSEDSPALWEAAQPYRRARPWQNTRLPEIRARLLSWWWLDSPAGLITAIALLLALVLVPLAIIS